MSASRPSGPAGLFFSRLFRRKLVLLAFVALVLIVLLAILAPWVSPYSPTGMRVSNRLKPPSLANWFGTDEFGRDVLSRIIHGGRASLGIGLAVVTASMLAGTTLGLLAGYYRSLDALVMRGVDAMMSLPDILLAIFLVAVLGASAGNVVLALSIVYTPRVVRVVRASTLVVRELPFVEAARTLGVSTWRILTVHVLLNVSSPILVQATFIFAYAVLAEAGLSFLGAGVPPDIPTWGTMIASGQQYADRALWVVLFPGLAIVLSALCLQLLGDGLRDMLDPKLRKAL
jgi:peptide/nickel transport system permease protein